MLELTNDQCKELERRANSKLQDQKRFISTHVVSSPPLRAGLLVHLVRSACPDNRPLDTKTIVFRELLEYCRQFPCVFQWSAFNFYRLVLHNGHPFDGILQTIGGEENARQSKDG